MSKVLRFSKTRPAQDARDIHRELRLHCESVEDMHFEGARTESNYCQVRFLTKFENSIWTLSCKLVMVDVQVP